MADAARSPSAPTLYSASASQTESAEPLIGYPAVPVEGQPVYGYPPPSLPFHRQQRRCGGRYGRIGACLCCLILVIVAVAAFFLWPRSIDMRLHDVALGEVFSQIKREGSIAPRLYLNLTLDLKLEAQNPNYFDVTYKTIAVTVHCNDDEIGEVETHGGDLKARSMTTVDAVLELNSKEVASNVLSLLPADIHNDTVPVQVTVTFDGHFNVLWFKLPLEANVTCNMVIDPDNQVVVSQSCSG